jgi:hypothetical protein
MKIITYRFPGFEAVTATKGNTFEVEGKSISDFGYTKDRTPLILHSADEIPCFFYVKEKILGAAVLDQAKILNEFLLQKLGALIQEENSIRKRSWFILDPASRSATPRWTAKIRLS